MNRGDRLYSLSTPKDGKHIPSSKRSRNQAGFELKFKTPLECLFPDSGAIWENERHLEGGAWLEVIGH